MKAHALWAAQYYHRMLSTALIIFPARYPIIWQQLSAVIRRISALLMALTSQCRHPGSGCVPESIPVPWANAAMSLRHASKISIASHKPIVWKRQELYACCIVDIRSIRKFLQSLEMLQCLTMHQKISQIGPILTATRASGLEIIDPTDTA